MFCLTPIDGKLVTVEHCKAERALRGLQYVLPSQKMCQPLYIIPAAGRNRSSVSLEAAQDRSAAGAQVDYVWAEHLCLRAGDEVAVLLMSCSAAASHVGFAAAAAHLQEKQHPFKGPAG
jgi:hypothetical protein